MRDAIPFLSQILVDPIEQTSVTYQNSKLFTIMKKLLLSKVNRPKELFSSLSSLWYSSPLHLPSDKF